MAEDRCRLCLESGNATLPIFQKKHGVALAKLTDILQIELRVGNGLPGRMCSSCASQLDAAYSFKQRCIASQKELKGQTMRAVRKASAGARARRQDKEYNPSDTDSDSVTRETESDGGCPPATADDGGREETKIGDEGGGGECRFCDERFATAEQLKEHLNKHEEKTEKSNKCLLCKKRFPSQSELRFHLQIHVDGGPVQCTLCDKVFLNETFLSQHLKSHLRPAADGPKSFSCDKCNKCFHKQAHLVEHVRSHTGDRPFKCPACDRCFTTKCNLTRHGRVHAQPV